MSLSSLEEKISDSPRQSRAFKQAMVVSMALYGRIIISSDVRLARSRPSMVGGISFPGSICLCLSYSDELQLILRISVVLKRSKRGAEEVRISRCGWIRWSKSLGLQLVGWLTRWVSESKKENRFNTVRGDYKV